MFPTEPFSPWVLFTDFSLIALLLLVSKLLRVKLRLMQQLFIPPSLLAGLLGLLLGPNGLGWLPFSGRISVYSAIFIAMVFGALPLSSGKTSVKDIGKRVGRLWAYGQIGMLGQWGLMGLFGIFVLCLIWPSLPHSFGIMLPTGFYGGHGTAAAIGAAFQKLGWEEALTLGMTTATLGVILAIIGGVVLIKIAARKGYTRCITDFKDLPESLRTGVIPEGQRDSMGEETTSSISIESVTFHLCMVLLVAFGGYLLSKGVKMWYPKLELPVFSCAFVVGLLFMYLMRSIKADGYICSKTMSRLASSCTDFLVAFGIASIKLDVVVKNAVPLLVILVTGVVVVLFLSLVLGRKMLKDYWFEKSIFCWGWWTGTMAMGIALLRIVDSKNQSKCLDDVALAYLPMAPVEIVIITLAPIAFTYGWGIWFSLSCVLLSVLIYALTMWRKTPKSI